MTILQDQTQTNASLQAEILALKAQLAAKGKLAYKVSIKGAVSIYGMGQFPATQYAEQWTRILDDADALRAFIKANDKMLAKKGQAPSPELVAHQAKLAALAAAKA